VYEFYNPSVKPRAPELLYAVRCLVDVVFRLFQFDAATGIKKSMQRPADFSSPCNKTLEVVYTDALLAFLQVFEKIELYKEFEEVNKEVTLYFTSGVRTLEELRIFASGSNSSGQFREDSNQTLRALLAYLHHRAGRYMSLTLPQALESMQRIKTYQNFQENANMAKDAVRSGAAKAHEKAGHFWGQLTEFFDPQTKPASGDAEA
jgi:hypothetical protein